MHIFQNFNEVTSFELRLQQFLTLRTTIMTNNKGQLRKKLLTRDKKMDLTISDQCVSLVLSGLWAKLSLR
jgi:hypothetical protein